MRMIDIIAKKRDGQILSDGEIKWFVKGYSTGEIPDYQASALLMAIFLKGLSEQETATLTLAMAESGDQADLSGISGVVADKHSTGGVADTTTLIVAPVAAACGVNVAKMSGRGLGHTGGTLDKLLSLPGMRVDLNADSFKKQVNEIGLAVIGQTMSMCPADKKLYALRDATATVDDISLIASSIMSKKIASGAPVIVLDVKTGKGAFMQKYEDSLQLAKEMVNIGTLAGRNVTALITDMDQPLGCAVGNALEVRGQSGGDLLKVSLALAAEMIFLTGRANSVYEARKKAKNAVDSGQAYRKLQEMISAQGGDTSVLDDLESFTQSKINYEVAAEEDGFIAQLDARRIGKASIFLGAGREKKEDVIDYQAGIWINRRVGDLVKKGETLFTIYAQEINRLEAAKERLKEAYTIGQLPPKKPKLIRCVVNRDGVREFE